MGEIETKRQKSSVSRGFLDRLTEIAAGLKDASQVYWNSVELENLEGPFWSRAVGAKLDEIRRQNQDATPIQLEEARQEIPEAQKLATMHAKREQAKKRAIHLYHSALQELNGWLTINPPIKPMIEAVRDQLQASNSHDAANWSIVANLLTFWSENVPLDEADQSPLGVAVGFPKIAGEKNYGRALSGGPSPGERIAAWIQTGRESQKSLAGKAGISRNTLSKIMKGKPVHSEKIAAVAEILGCSYKDLLPTQ
jgi:DNA-binding Xre family transcriptional regulator